jgi:hypothetical protein
VKKFLEDHALPRRFIRGYFARTRNALCTQIRCGSTGLVTECG